MHATPESVRNKQTSRFGNMSLLTCTVDVSVSLGGKGIRLNDSDLNDFV